MTTKMPARPLCGIYGLLSPALTALLPLLLAALFHAGQAIAGPKEIRENLPRFMPQITKIDDVSESGIKGLWAVRVGGEMVYTNDDGTLMLQGQLLDLKTKANLTQAALDKALAVDLNSLPFKDAVVAFKEGKGQHKMAVFVDPNCTYCKHFEPELAKLKDVTVYAFVMPMLGADSQAKGRSILCAADPGAAWHAWMLNGVLPPAAPAGCDSSALQRNLALANKLGVTGTPTTLLADRSRFTGAVPVDKLQARIDAQVASSSK